jgi:murein DD-endopeptidase MepM/ murein hydrolase activator NlpD
VKNQLYKSLALGISCAIAATASYALIVPEPLQEKGVRSTPLTSLIAPEASVLDITPPVVPDPQTNSLKTDAQKIAYKIKSGDNLSVIFSKLNLSHSELHTILHANDLAKQFANIKPGKNIIAHLDGENNLVKLTYAKNAYQTLIAEKSNDGFDVDLLSKPVTQQVSNSQGIIESSLYLDGKEAGLTDKLIIQLADIFAWDIDFAMDLRKGDQFTVVYEKFFADGKEVKTGNIISAEFINQGETYTAVRFEDEKGNTNYYTPDGKSMRKAFLRTPVDFARISSHFNLKRKHPVLNRIRAHKGVDYAAQTGTPVKTTANGKITFRGKKGGYGNVVIVQHGETYSTLYAHLSKFKQGLKTGSSIKQGDIIGYVGKSGLATGPHLHYEFRVNGIHKNPLTVKLPKAEPIKPALLAQFKQQTTPLLAQLEKAKSKTILAQTQTQ